MFHLLFRAATACLLAFAYYYMVDIRSRFSIPLIIIATNN